jgi:hypothetical protein
LLTKMACTPLFWLKAFRTFSEVFLHFFKYYKIDRIEVMIDKSNHFISKVQMRSLIRDNPKVSSDMVFRHALKKDFSKYRRVVPSES